MPTVAANVYRGCDKGFKMYTSHCCNLPKNVLIGQHGPEYNRMATTSSKVKYAACSHKFNPSLASTISNVTEQDQRN